MKSFYEVTAIDTNNLLEVEVELIEHNTPKYIFKVNELPVVSHNTFSFCLLDVLDFSCKVESGAIEIKKIAINSKEVLPKYLHLADPKTVWITNNWSFSIPQPFYPWYHQITGQGWIA